MLRLIKILLILLMLLVLSVFAIFITSLDSKPLVVVSSGEQINEAESVQALLTQLSQSLKNRTRFQNIPISEKQLNSLVGFAQRANGKINGQANIRPQASTLSISYELPDNPFGNYINVSVVVLPGLGLQISEVNIGRFSVPGEYALSTVVWLADWWTKSDIASQFIAQVERVEMFDSRIILALHPLDGFLNELNHLQQGLSVNNDDEQRQKTAHYLKFIVDLGLGTDKKPLSLARFIGPVFAETLRISAPETAVNENEAAILALAIYAGHHRFANFVGDVQPVPGKVALPKKRPVLAERSDLNQHFIFSAAIKVLSEQGMSAAIGEFKELMDRANGGSGFSFVDLAADFAGVEFAQAATDPLQAQHVQQVLADNTKESAFFPAITNLPEGMSKAVFNQKFGSVDSREYQSMVEDIRGRIMRLPIHIPK
ncbi:MAG: hypothetical protein ACI88A_003594 [Paraglaciecola sp.]